MAPLIGRRIGSYEIQALLGKGGMGEVYRATDTKLGRAVAIKILPADFAADPDRVERFEREARVLASLNHPNIGAIYGLEDNDGVSALVLELVEGPTLAERGRMPVAETLPIARQIAEAIEAAHERGIVHRDLKPANVKLSSTGTVKVLDFGLAKFAAQSDDQTMVQTEAGMVVGTVGYMSPEQARGAAVDKRSDVWAFGCVLYEMLAGVSPFRGASAVETLTAIATRDPDYALLPADVPPAVRQLIARCLEKDPQLRLRDIGEARIALLAVIAGDAPRIPSARSRGVPRWAWMGVAAAVAIGALAWAAWRTMSATPTGERLEFTIAPPEGVVWGELPEDPWPRLSPDGQHLVFTGRSASGTYGLWIRDVASADAHLVPNAQDVPRVAWPFWSPDSRTVAYCDGTQIKKVDLGGRPPETIAAKCNWLGAAWNARGQILYPQGTGLFSISDKGGVETRITTSAPGTQHFYPRWLPDGRRFLYTASGPPETAGIYLATIDGGAPTRLLPDRSASEYVETGGQGYLFFVRVATLLVQRVNPKSLAPIGDPVPLAGRMGMGVARGPSMAVSASLLVYRSGASFGDSTLVWMDRHGVSSGRTYAAHTPIDDIALSHDGATIAFGRFNRDTNNIELWTVDAAHGTEQPVYAPPHFASNPVFSPDDRTLAMGDALIPSSIQIGSAGPPVPLTTQGGLATTDWSADGRTVFAASGLGLTGVWAVPVGQPGAAAVRLHEGVQPRLSPDGHWLAYTSTETGTPQIVVERYPGGADKQRISTNGGFQPVWRADGAEMFYLTSDGDMMAVRIRIGARIDAGEPVRLFREHFAADGANFVRADYGVTRDGQHFLVKLASGDPKPLTAVRNWVSGLK